MESLRQLLVFRLGEQAFAVDLPPVLRVVRMVEVTPLPGAPPGVLGAINVQGRILPIIDIRPRCALPSPPPCISDRLILLNLPGRTAALLVNEVLGVTACPTTDVVSASTLFPGFQTIDGVMNLQEEIVVIHHLDSFLSLEDERALQEALCDAGESGP